MHENPTKIAKKDTKITQATRRRSMQLRKLPYSRRSNEKQSARLVCAETLELIYMSPSGLGKKPSYP
jgi:hypothetical protein